MIRILDNGVTGRMMAVVHRCSIVNVLFFGDHGNREQCPPLGINRCGFEWPRNVKSRFASVTNPLVWIRTHYRLKFNYPDTKPKDVHRPSCSTARPPFRGSGPETSCLLFSIKQHSTAQGDFERQSDHSEAECLCE